MLADLQIHWQTNRWLLPLLVFTATAGVLVVLRHLAERFLRSLVQRPVQSTGARFAEIVLASMRQPSLLWIGLLALYLAVSLATLPPSVVATAHTIIQVLLIASATLVCSQIARGAIGHYARTIEDRLPVTSLTQNLASVLILTVGALTLLHSLGVSIVPILTALGVGGIAVALALQDTLSNLFAGLYIILSRNIRVGDFVRLDTGDEGAVMDIAWRVTRIRTGQNNIVIIPNYKLAQAIVTNFHLIERRLAVPIPVSVGYAQDPDRVEQILLDEVRKAVGQVPGLLAEPAPIVRFIPGFGQHALDLTLTCHVLEYTDRDPVQHELRKRILRRFKQEGIEIPVPQRVIHVRDETKGGH